LALPIHLTTNALRELLGGRFRKSTKERSWVALREPRLAGPDDVAVLGERVSLSDKAACRAGLKIVGIAFPEAAGLEVDSPELALSVIVRHFATTPTSDEWLSADDVVDRFGEISRYSRIHRSAVIGEGATLGAGVVIHAGVRVGKACVLGDQIVLGSQGFGFSPGASGRFEALPHRAGVVLEDDVQIGASTNIAAGLIEPTRVGRGSRLDAMVQVGHNCQIGADCILAAQTGLSGSVELGDGCMVGGQAGFADHVRLGPGCRVAGQAGVTRSWPAGTVLVGFPARPHRQWNRDFAHSVLAKRTLLRSNP